MPLLLERVEAFNPDQERDEKGRFGSGSASDNEPIEVTEYVDDIPLAEVVDDDVYEAEVVEDSIDKGIFKNRGISAAQVALAFGKVVPGGNQLTTAQIADRCREMSGLPAGAKIQSVKVLVSVKGPLGDDRLVPIESVKQSVRDNPRTKVAFQVESSGGDVAKCIRTFKETSKGTVCENEILLVKDSSQGKGVGTKLFADQVAALQKAGVVRIEAQLARADSKTLGFNGYYTWPRLGYNAKIPDSAKAKLKAELGPKAKVDTVQDLMRTEKGRDAWKRLGVTVDGKFDLSARSVGVRVLQKYIAEKANRKIAASLTGSSYDLGRNGPSDLDDEILDRIWDEVGQTDEIEASRYLQPVCILPGTGRYLDRIVAFNPDQERDEKGRFGSGGGTSDAEESEDTDSGDTADDALAEAELAVALEQLQDTHTDQEDALRESQSDTSDAVDEKREIEDAEIEKARDAEDAQIASERKAIEKEQSKEDKRQAKEKAAIDAERSKEDRKLADAPDEEVEAVESRREAEDAAREAANEKIDADFVAKLEELDAREAKIDADRAQEDKSREAAREAEDRARKSNQRAERNALFAKQEKEKMELRNKAPKAVTNG